MFLLQTIFYVISLYPAGFLISWIKLYTNDYTSKKETLDFFNYTLIKELNFCPKLWFPNFNIAATQCCRLLKFQTMNTVRSNNVSLKYQRFILSGCKDIRIKKIELVAKTQFLSGSGATPRAYCRFDYYTIHRERTADLIIILKVRQ